VVQGALKLIVEPMFEADFCNGSYGYRPRRTAQEAVARVDQDIVEGVPPVITRQTTMWKAWIGFNAKSQLWAILFGAIYAYVAVAHPSVLFRSTFLVASGGVLLLGYIILAKLYWFSAPFRWTLLALACYVAGFAVAWE
jgi:hypothetical protein